MTQKCDFHQIVEKKIHEMELKYTVAKKDIESLDKIVTDLRTDIQNLRKEFKEEVKEIKTNLKLFSGKVDKIILTTLLTLLGGVASVIINLFFKYISR